MRYRDLIIVLLLVAGAAWFFAPPSAIWERSDVSVSLEVLPGTDLASTSFIVQLRGPDRYWPPANDGGRVLDFHFASHDTTVYAGDYETIGPLRYLVRGSDLHWYNRSSDRVPLKLRAATTCFVESTAASDDDKGPYNRGGGRFAVRSQPVAIDFPPR